MNSKFSLILLSVPILIDGCADDTAGIVFNPQPADTGVLALMQSSTVRLRYTYSGLVDSNGSPQNFVNPPGAIPLNQTVKDSSGNSKQVYNWATATGAGLPYPASGGLTLAGIPMGKKLTQIGIEFLQPVQINGATGYYVVASYCYVDSSGNPLSADQLQADLDSPANAGAIVVTKTRICGTCTNPPELVSDPTTPCTTY